MRWKQEPIFIIRRLIYRRRVEREWEDEIRARLKMEVERNIVDGGPYKNTFTGTIESLTKMSGAVEFVKGPARWTATKK
ncbi:MAG TPA: hypothetical protein VJZ77_24525 [Blastocatellia bacterium]|nr:hypothetical protein [Blastocatellia bacterium]